MDLNGDSTSRNGDLRWRFWHVWGYGIPTKQQIWKPMVFVWVCWGILLSDLPKPITCSHRKASEWWIMYWKSTGKDKATEHMMLTWVNMCIWEQKKPPKWPKDTWELGLVHREFGSTGIQPAHWHIIWHIFEYPRVLPLFWKCSRKNSIVLTLQFYRIPIMSYRQWRDFVCQLSASLCCDMELVDLMKKQSDARAGEQL